MASTHFLVVRKQRGKYQRVWTKTKGSLSGNKKSVPFPRSLKINVKCLGQGVGWRRGEKISGPTLTTFLLPASDAQFTAGFWRLHCGDDQMRQVNEERNKKKRKGTRLFLGMVKGKVY